ncbi:uncharacterized protein [Paramormyrops kingsleyae]|uniref:uncharacterized protein isoform X3 n=1 Tax=Paramormyrops kingsleyae TaxID=1676925 RepID=UPI003B974830
MLGYSFLLAALLLCLAGQSLQGGVQPPGGPLGRAVPSRGLGIGAGPGVGGAKAGGTRLPFPQQGGLGFGGGPFGGRSVKAGGPYPGAQLGRGGAGAGPWQPFGPQGGFGAGPSLGNGLGVGPQLGKPRKGYAANGFGYGGTLGGYGPAAGIFPRPGLSPGTGRAGVQNGQGAKAAKAGYGPQPGGYTGVALGNGFGPGVGAAGYPQVGKARPADFGAGRGVFPGAALANGFAPGLATDPYGGQGLGLGVQPGKYGGAGGGPGVGVGGPQAHLPYGGQAVVPARLGGNGKAVGYSQGLSPYGAHPVQPVGLADDRDLGGLGGEPGGGLFESTAGKRGGIGQLYNGAPVVPVAQNGNGGYPYGPQALAANGKPTSKHGDGGYQNGPVQPAGYVGLGDGAGPYGGKESKYGLNGFFGNGYRG